MTGKEVLAYRRERTGFLEVQVMGHSECVCADLNQVEGILLTFAALASS